MFICSSYSLRATITGKYFSMILDDQSLSDWLRINLDWQSRKVSGDRSRVTSMSEWSKTTFRWSKITKFNDPKKPVKIIFDQAPHDQRESSRSDIVDDVIYQIKVTTTSTSSKWLERFRSIGVVSYQHRHGLYKKRLNAHI